MRSRTSLASVGRLLPDASLFDADRRAGRCALVDLPAAAHLVPVAVYLVEQRVLIGRRVHELVAAEVDAPSPQPDDLAVTVLFEKVIGSPEIVLDLIMQRFTGCGRGRFGHQAASGFKSRRQRQKEQEDGTEPDRPLVPVHHRSLRAKSSSFRLIPFLQLPLVFIIAHSGPLDTFIEVNSLQFLTVHLLVKA
jgi:hypothetical protein